MMTEQKNEQAEKNLVEAEKAMVEKFKTQMVQLLEEKEKELDTDVKLTEAQRLCVEKSLEEALQAEKILKDSKNKDEYEDFTQEDKEILKPAILMALKLKAMETQGSAIVSHLQGTLYGGIKKTMQECKIKRFRGFCKLTGYSHTTVYRKVKVAESYKRETLENHPSVDLKALYEVAVNKGDKADETLANNHAALARAGSDVHEVRKILNPNYKPVKKIVKPDGIANSPDNKLRAEFHLLKARIIIDGVTEADWANFQMLFINQNLWSQFKVWKKLREEELENRESGNLEEENDASTQVDTEDGETGANDILHTEELFAVYQAQWDDPKCVDDDGNMDIAPECGVDDLDAPGWLEGRLFVKYMENGSARFSHKKIFSNDFPLTSRQVNEQLEKIRQDHPGVTDAMFTDDEEHFVVGTENTRR